MELQNNEKNKNALMSIAEKHGWNCVEAEENRSTVEINLPSGRQFWFQVTNDCADEEMYLLATTFDQDAYMRKLILDHPEWPVQEVVHDGDFITCKLSQLAEDIQPWAYDPEGYLNRVLMEAEQLGWRVYQNIAEFGDTIVLSKEIGGSWNYAFEIDAQTACTDITCAVADFNRDTMACKFAAFYGGQNLVTGDPIPKQWQQLADETFKELQKLEQTVDKISESNPTKCLWMRCGVTFHLSAWDYAEVCRGTSMGQEILKRKFELGDCHLDGETYAPDNRCDADEYEWKHDEFGFDF